ncbi:DUF4347 domain-containing protein [Moorena producens JHB]|uniref:DUF4347 domain-containing protein n=1 Tax=Moorena producens (strain JHB) TaxID=1454205 RepID=A0A1D9FW08_MOOP1|nr:LamG-like jellyroll fold domain-containing protein [Moorena producens]AOY79568.2 DUF4347 domain-containing protein [Moorena producens JHB]
MSESTSSTIVFIDAAVENYQELANGVEPGTEVVILDSSQDGIEQITAALAGREGIDNIQIVSHGAEGMLQLGSTQLNSENLEAYQAQLEQWGDALTESGDILLLGCNVAGDDHGVAFVEELSQVTGADIAASDDLTGSNELGGDWVLEVATGMVDAPLAFQVAAMEAYNSVLATYKVTNTNDSGAGSLRDAIIKANATPGVKDVIDLSGAVATPNTIIFLQSSLPTITDSVSFFGGPVIHGRGLHQIFTVNTPGIVTFNDLNIQAGLAKGGNGVNGGGGGLGAGGGIFINQGQVFISNSFIGWNSAQGGNATGTAGAGGHDERSGGNGGTGGGFNITADYTFNSNGAVGLGGQVDHSKEYQNNGTNGGNSTNFGTGGASGGGGSGGRNDVPDEAGNGGKGGNGSFGAGGGGGGGAGKDIDSDSGDEDGAPGSFGSGGLFGGNGASGSHAAGENVNSGGAGGQGGGGAGLGGAIFVNSTASLTLSNTTFLGNTVTGGTGANAGQALGANIFVRSGGTAQSYGNSITNTYGSIANNLTLPTVSVSSTTTITEANAGIFTFTLGHTLPFDYYIGYSVGGTATSGADFLQTLPGYIFIPKNSLTATLDINVNDDRIYEPNDETVTLTLNSNTPNIAPGAGTATITIQENEPLLSISKTKDATEGNQNGEFEITFNKTAPQDFHLYLELTNNNATLGKFTNTKQGADYKLFYEAYRVSDPNQISDSNPIWLASGEIDTAETGDIYKLTNIPTNTKLIKLRVEQINDEIYEAAPESVTIRLLDNYTTIEDGYSVNSSQDQAIVTINDNEPKVTIGKVVNPTKGFEFGSTIEGLGKALTLDGSSYVDLPSNASLNLSGGNFTQEAWIFNNATDNAARGILGYDSTTAGQNYPSISVVNQTDIKVSFGDGSTDRSFTVSNALIANAWNHVATTFDGTNYKIYVNGVEKASQAFVGITPLAATQQLTIGKVGTESFQGAIDEVRIWNVARTQAQIQSTMLSSLQGTEPGLVGYWQFEGNTNDSSTNNNNGTFVGTANYIENPAPQIGYVEVNLDQPFDGVQGLWVEYEIANSSTATQNDDYLNSRIRRVSNQPITERNGIIIPQGETTGRIYFSALSDAVVEGDETITINLVKNNFDIFDSDGDGVFRRSNNEFPADFDLNNNGVFDPSDANEGEFISNYGLGATTSATLTLSDHQAYQPGVVILDQFNQPVTASNPLLVRDDGTATLKVKLTSQPTDPVTVNLSSDQGSLDRSAVTLNSTGVGLSFDGTDDYVDLDNTSLSFAGTQPFTISAWVNPETDGGTIVGKHNTGVRGSYFLDVESDGRIRFHREIAPWDLYSDTAIPFGQWSHVAATYDGTTMKVYINGQLAGQVASGAQFNDNATPVLIGARQEDGSPTNLFNGKIDDVQIWDIARNQDQIKDTINHQLVGNEPGLIAYYQANEGSGTTLNDYSVNNNHGTLQNGTAWLNSWDAPITVNLTGASTSANVSISSLVSNDTNYNNASLDRTITLTDTPNYRVIEGANTPVLVPEVSIETAGDVKEGDSQAGQFVVSLNTPAPEAGLTINYSISGTVTPTDDVQIPGADLAQQTGTITIAPGESRAVLAITPVNDALIENNETVTVTLETGNNYNLSSNAEATITIIDNDRPGIELANAVAKDYSLQFDGVDDYISINLDEPETEITHELWFKTSNANGGIFSVVDKDNIGANDRHIYLNNGNLSVRVFNHEFLTTSGLNLADGQWHHVAHVIGSSVGGQKLYIDGNLVDSGTKAQSDFDWQNQLRIGYSFDATNQYFDGEIKEVRVWDVARTEAEIQENINRSLTGTEAGLTVYLTSDRAVGTQLVDRTGNGNNGILNNGVEIIERIAYNQNTTQMPKLVVTTSEDGGSDTFGVRLTAKPTADVTVTFTDKISAIQGVSSDEGTFSTTSLTFTPDNWDVYQGVTVTGQNDTERDGNQTNIVAAVATSSDIRFDNQFIDFEVTNIDDDGVTQKPEQSTLNVDSSLPIARVIPVSETIAEGQTAQFNITLSAPPTTDALVLFSVQGGTATLGKDFQPVETVFIEQNKITTGQALTVADALTQAQLDATYPNSSGNNSVKYIDLDGDGDTDAKVTDASGNITNYLAFQGVKIPSGSTSATINIEITDDAIAENPELLEVKLHAGGIGYRLDHSIPTDTVTPGASAATASDLGNSSVTVTDAISVANQEDWYKFTLDAPGIETSNLKLNFTHGNGDLQVELFDTLPDVNTTALRASNFQTDNETISLAGLKAGQYWVRVSGVESATNPSYELTLDLPTTTANPVIATTTIQDNDNAGVLIKDANGNAIANGKTLTITSLSATTEGDGPLSFTAQLKSKPTTTVKLYIGSSDATEGKLSSAANANQQDVVALTFTPDNWDVAQTFSLHPQDDAIDDGDVIYQVAIEATSQDQQYQFKVPDPTHLNLRVTQKTIDPSDSTLVTLDFTTFLSGDGTIAKDSKLDFGNGVVGTVQEDVNLTPSQSNRAFNFDGNNANSIELGKGNAATLGLPTSQMTIEAWVKIDSFKDWSAVISFLQDNGSEEAGFALGTWSDNRFYFALAGGDEGLTYLSSNKTYETGQWYHLAAVYNSSQMELLVNGESVGTSTAQSGDIYYRDSWYRLGQYKDDNEDFTIDGQIAEVRVWNVARNKAQIVTNMNRQLNGDEAGLVDYFKPDENTSFYNANINAIVNGNIPVFTAGTQLSQGAFYFDGDGDYIELSNGKVSATTLGLPTTAITVEARVSLDSFEDWASFIGFFQDNGDTEAGFALGTFDNNRFYFALAGGGNGLTYLESNIAFPPSPFQWYHVAATYDGSKMELFVNGQSFGVSFNESGAIHYLDSWYRIGQYKDDNEDESVNGRIHEVRVWNQARTQAEIQADMNRVLNGDEAGLVTHYKFENNKYFGRGVSSQQVSNDEFPIYNVKQTGQIKVKVDTAESAAQIQGNDLAIVQDNKDFFTIVNPLTIVNQDDSDTVGLTITPPSVTPEGEANIYTVSLNSEPTAPVRVKMNPTLDQIKLNNGEVGEALTLVFDQTNWNKPQTVQITAIDDDVVEFAHSSQIEFQITSEDTLYNQLTQAPLDVAIEDNDLPTATITAGATASEVFSEPSYFNISLNTAAPSKLGDTGIEVNYRIKGGSATLGGDYNIQQERSVRIAPGDVQNNLIVVPIDDKLIEDLNLELTSNPTVGTTSNGKQELTIPVEITLNQETILNKDAQINFGNGVIGTVKSINFDGTAKSEAKLTPQIRAFDFSGNNGHSIELGKGNAAMLGLPTSQMTLEAWVKIDSFKDWSAVISFLQDNGSEEAGFALGTWSDNRFYFALAGGDDGLTYLSSNKTYQTGQWYHLAAVYNGSQMELLVNGESVGTSTAQSGLIHYHDSWYRLGKYKDDNEDFTIDGQIAEVRVWNVARNQAQIASNMNRQLNGDEAGLVDYFKPDENTSFYNDNLLNNVTLNGNIPVINTTGTQLSQGAFYFDGDEDYIELSNGKVSAASLGLPTTAITVEARVSLDSFEDWASFIGFFQDNGDTEAGFALGTKDNNRFYFALAGGGNGLTYLESNIAFPPSPFQWYHVAATYDGSKMELFVNGQSFGVSFNESGAIHYLDSWYRIGQYKDNNEDESVNGRIQEVRVWDVARNQTQIQADMNRTLNGDEAGLVTHYKFESNKYLGRGVSLQQVSNDEFPNYTVKQTGTITVEVDAEQGDRIGVNPNQLSSAKIEAETVVVELLPGEGYQLDPNNTEATLSIADDDVPGVRILQVGEHTVVREEETATYQISLLSEPTSNVTVTLTPGAEIEFDNPNGSTVNVTKDNYSFSGTADSNGFVTQSNLQAKLTSLVTTDRDKTVALDLKLESDPGAAVVVTLDDGFDTSHNPSDQQILFFSQDEYSEKQQAIVAHLDANPATTNTGLYQINGTVDSYQFGTTSHSILGGAHTLTVTLDRLDTINDEAIAKVKLSSQPTNDVKVVISDSTNSSIKKTLTFTDDNWQQEQQVTFKNLTDTGTATQPSYELSATVNDTALATTLGINRSSQATILLPIDYSTSQVSKQQTTVTITPENWYKLNTVTIRGSRDGVAEPGLYHTSTIDYAVSSSDTDYNGLFVPTQTIHVADRILDAQETANAIKQGLDTLQESFDNLSLPLIGILEGKAPPIISQLSAKLTNAVSSEKSLTALKLQGIIESNLESLGLDFFNVTTDLTPRVPATQSTPAKPGDISIQIDFSKQESLFNIGLDQDLGLPALGIGFETNGALTSTFDYGVSFGFGLHDEDGFYINTDTTKIDAGVQLNLDEFSGTGSLGFLRVDFADDTTNPTELSVDFTAGLKDTVQFLNLDAGNTLTTLKGKTILEPFYIGKNSSNFNPIRQDVTSYYLDLDASGNFSSNVDFRFRQNGTEYYLDLDGNNSFKATIDQTVSFDPSNSNSYQDNIVSILNDNSRLSISELNNFRQTNDLKFLDLVSYDLSGNANLGLSAVTSINGSSAFPSFSFDIAAGLPIFNYNNEKEASSNGTTVNFNNIQVDLGTFLTDFAQPILKTVDTIIEPIKPVIDALTTDTEFLGYIGLESPFDKNDDGEVNVLEIAQTIAESVKDPRAKKIVTAIEFANTIIDIVGVVEELADIPSGESIIIDVGDYSLGSFKVGSNNKANSASKVRQSSNGATFNDSGKNASFEQDVNNKKSNGKKSGSALSKLKALKGIDIPLISSPVTAVQLLLGESDVDLLTYDIPDIDFGFDVSKDFAIWGPVQGVFKGDFSAKTDLSIGYDTRGIEDWRDADFAPEEAYKVLNGFYVNDNVDDAGNDAPEFTVDAELRAGVALSGGVAEVELTGGIIGNVDFDLEDEGEYNGTSDGKIRGHEIVSRISNPLDLFELNGALEASIKGEVQIGIDVGFIEIMETVWETELARFKLAEFSIGGGSGFSGTLGNSYITDATVFFDGNFNGIIDDNEIKVVTDFKGSFTFEETFDFESFLNTFDTNNNGVIDINEGRLAAVGGTDTSSGLPVVTPLFAIPDSNMITPLTTLKAKLAELGTEAETAESLVKTALDLPLGIDLNNFDAQDAIARGDEKGAAVYIVHVQVQNLITQVTGLIQDLTTATPEVSAEAAIEALATGLTASGDIVNISDTQQLRATIVPTIKSQIQLLGGTQRQEEALQSILDEAAAIMAQANQDILEVAAQAPIDSLIDIIAPVKRRTQGELPQQILELATTAVATSSTEDETEVNGGSITIETTEVSGGSITIEPELISLSTENETELHGGSIFIESNVLVASATDNETEDDNQSNSLEQDTVEDTQQIPLTLTQQQSNLLLLGGDSTTASLEFSLTQKNLSQGTVHEVAVFAVENEQAQINGLLPTDVGYKQAALESAEVVFSVIADNFIPNPSRIVSGFNGNNLAFLIVENGSVDGALNGQVSLDNVLLGTDSNQVLQINQLAENSFSLTFNDLVINAELTDKTPILGTNLQGKSQAEVFDLRDFTGQQIQVAAPIVEGESIYDNTVGFYSVEDETGAVRDPLTGNVINPGEAGYTQAAIRNSQFHLDETSDGMTVTVTGGAILAPFIIANGTTEQILDNDETNDPSVYFAYMSANSDQVNHIRLLGDNTWGFEDLSNGGDKDYNDVVIKMDLSVI